MDPISVQSVVQLRKAGLTNESFGRSSAHIDSHMDSHMDRASRGNPLGTDCPAKSRYASEGERVSVAAVDCWRLRRRQSKSSVTEWR